MHLPGSAKRWTGAAAHESIQAAGVGQEGGSLALLPQGCAEAAVIAELRLTPLDTTADRATMPSYQQRGGVIWKDWN